MKKNSAAQRRDAILAQIKRFYPGSVFLSREQTARVLTAHGDHAGVGDHRVYAWVREGVKPARGREPVRLVATMLPGGMVFAVEDIANFIDALNGWAPRHARTSPARDAVERIVSASDPAPRRFRRSESPKTLTPALSHREREQNRTSGLRTSAPGTQHSCDTTDGGRAALVTAHGSPDHHHADAV